MKSINKLNLILIVIFIFNLPITIVSLNSFNLYAQNPDLLENSWFVHSTRNISTNNFLDDILNTDPELRFELTFSNDKITLVGCCGGVFEMDVNYIGNDSLQILNLTETEAINCNSSFVLDFYNTIKGAFNNLIGSPIDYQISSYSQILYLNINYQNNSSFVNLTNIPLEDTDHSTSPYWGHEPPNHQWSLTQVNYQGQTMELPYGAALTTADIYEGSFAISLCGEIFVALNSSWYLDVEELIGPCFISCGILENTTGACELVSGYDVNYLETFKQNTFNFLNDNINQTMEYTFTFGANSQDARKLVIEDFSQNKLVFHSNENYLSTTENSLLSEIFIYPNPVVDFLILEAQDCTSCIAKLYNITGKLLKNQSLSSSQNFINVKDFDIGLYFIVVENEYGNKQTQKFIKK
ncbi:T9SS type A sorting domain-containing protein [uncultured Planktosalinus sp.]|uniref:T9SS type A sorting domain-containing protein n=1 Tax=uncultured Planktosalinus sp. TaxID=1810935 RepID=UPI0030D82FB8